MPRMCRKHKCSNPILVNGSSCRYKSFSRDRDNIGDITAKGEAQIAVIDLLGLLLGVRISRLTELSRVKVVAVFVLLSGADLYCVYNEIQRYAPCSATLSLGGKSPLSSLITPPLVHLIWRPLRPTLVQRRV